MFAQKILIDLYVDYLKMEKGAKCEFYRMLATPLVSAWNTVTQTTGKQSHAFQKKEIAEKCL